MWNVSIIVHNAEKRVITLRVSRDDFEIERRTITVPDMDKAGEIADAIISRYNKFLAQKQAVASLESSWANKFKQLLDDREP